jgi:hypothetical protein
MCDEDSTGIGEIVPNDRMIYRACKRSIDLSKDKTTVEPIAFQKDGQNHRDGLSLALSVDACARQFPNNRGVIRISVGAIHGLGRGLEVHFDTADPDHAIIRNLPCMDRELEKELALIVSSELAAAAEIESSKRVLSPPAAPPAIGP